MIQAAIFFLIGNSPVMYLLNGNQKNEKSFNLYNENGPLDPITSMRIKPVFFIMVCSTMMYCCVSNTIKPGGMANNISSLKNDTVNYATDILPVLRTKCSPCHFPGGKMYEKMPFDNSLTILGHDAGVFKRIKEEPAAGLIRKFMLQRSKVNE